MLLKSQILEAQANSRSANECARYLKVHKETYKKWAQYYGIYENVLNKEGVGISKGGLRRADLEPYIKGEKTHKHARQYIQQLIKHGWKKDCCEHCGYDHKRSDGKVPLLINFLDGNKYNTKLDNCQILCYNCYYVIVGTELIGIKTRRYWTPDYFNQYNTEDYHKENDFKFDDFDEENIDESFYKETKDIDKLFDDLNK